MNTLVHLGLLNAALATILALPALAARCLRLRPALVHGLWLLVLLKLLTPPLLVLPIAWLPGPEPKPSLPAAKVEPSARLSEEDSFSSRARAPAVGDSRQPPEDETGLNEMLTRDSPAPRASETVPGPAERPAESNHLASVPVPEGQPWEHYVAAFWLAGSVLWWTVACVRLHRFRKSLHSAWPAPAEVQQRTARLAEQLGLSRCPRVYVLPAPIAPLLWAVIGKPCLLLPAILWTRLTREQQDTLLAHELAHLRRGDPWIRRLEIVVLGLYWWHPVVWWARHEIQEAEEQCCDAWVLWAIPTAAEMYAAALLETVAFLSRLRPALPVGASGVGHTRLLRRRLTMILRGNTRRALSWTALAVFFVCGAALLPLRPTWGQDRPPTPTADTTPFAPTAAASTPLVAQETTKSPGTKISGPAVSIDAGLTGVVSAPRDIEEAKDAVELMQVQLDGKKAELLEARALVEQSRRQLDRLSKLRAQGTVSEDEVDQLRTELTVREARLRAKEAQIREAEVRLRQANRWLSRLERGAQGPGSTGASPSVGTQPLRYPTPSATGAQSGVPAAEPRVGTNPSSATNSHLRPGPGGTLHKALDNSTIPGGDEKRMRDLEMKLEKLLKEVDALRREIRRQQSGGGSGAASTPSSAPKQ